MEICKELQFIQTLDAPTTPGIHPELKPVRLSQRAAEAAVTAPRTDVRHNEGNRAPPDRPVRQPDRHKGKQSSN